jgi:membrane peptidoglycan carboxypeptidase
MQPGAAAPTRRTTGAGGSPFPPVGAGGGAARGSAGGAGGSRGSGAGGRGGSGGSGGGNGRGGSGRNARGGGKRPRRIIDYPRWGKRGIRRWLPSWRLVLGTFATFMLLGVGAFAYLYATTEIPQPADFAQAQTTTVYFSDSTTVMGTFGAQNRVIVPADQIAQSVKDAVVAGEDRSFYRNPGIDPVGILRALWNNLRHGTHQGGSSITQQYAERFYFDKTVSSYSGKLKEAMLAIKLDRQQDKDEILSNYLNTIYFGRDSYGVQTASMAYFGVGVDQLDVSQAALLAAVIPSPNKFDPRISQEKAERRWNYVLDGMVATGALTQAERDTQVFPATVEFSRSDRFKGTNGYLLDMVRNELYAQTPITEDDLLTRGYTIVTTIDPSLQQQMVDAVARIPADHAPNLKVGVVTLAPEDGAILALYGGPDFLTVQRNAVTQDRAQAGSTFKPFALTAYLENGGSLKSQFSGANGLKMAGFPNGKVSNYGDESTGVIDLVKATAKSINTVYAQVNEAVGPDKTVTAAEAAGLPKDTAGLSDNLANVLGSASPHPLDMARAYNTFSAGGLRTSPFIVRSVTYLDGRVVHTGGVTPERVFPADVMADVTYALEGPPKAGGTAKQVAKVGYPVAGKTGTSTDNKSAWFVGFTKQLTTAVAFYQVGPNGEEESITPFGGYKAITGGTVSADLWTDYMTTAMAGREKLDFGPPAYVGKPNVAEKVAVPDVTGQASADAQAAISGAGFQAVTAEEASATVPEGHATRTDPPAGTEADKGSTVTVVISTGPGKVTVPEVGGQSADAAKQALTALGLVVQVSEATSPTVPAGQAIGTDPGAGVSVTAGSTVTLRVSTGAGGGSGGGGGGGSSPSPTPSPSGSTSP